MPRAGASAPGSEAADLESSINSLLTRLATVNAELAALRPGPAPDRP
jgi:hypothetical protein